MSSCAKIGDDCPEEEVISGYVHGATMSRCKKHSLSACLGLSGYPIFVCFLFAPSGVCEDGAWLSGGSLLTRTAELAHSPLLPADAWTCHY